MHLVPVLPMLSDESTMSYVARVARFHCAMGPFECLNLIVLARKQVIEGTAYGFNRIAEITGIPRPTIEAGNYFRVRERIYQHRGQEFHAEFIGRVRTSYCSACLSEGGAQDGPSKGQRFGRVNWLFTPIRTCPRHGIGLVRRRNKSYDEAYQDMSLVATEDRILRTRSESTSSRKISPLQAYVEERLAGAAGAPWLDEQPIDTAARASEMLGACLLFGTHVDLTTLGDDEWDAAGGAGYLYTSRGVEGIQEALDHLRKPSATGASGPQAAFDRLFQWL